MLLSISEGVRFSVTLLDEFSLFELERAVGLVKDSDDRSWRSSELMRKFSLSSKGRGWVSDINESLLFLFKITPLATQISINRKN